MDSDVASIFDDLPSPGMSLLDATNIDLNPFPQSTLPIDLINASETLSEWDRPLQSLPPPPKTTLPIPVAWIESPLSSSVSNPLLSRQVPLHDDDEDSVDYTSPPAEKKRPSQSPNSSMHDLGQALERAAQTPRSRRRHPESKREPALEVRGNVSHTRRCRAKVNNNFERLLHTLPPPPEGVEVKHKAQILAYAIDRFRAIRCHNMKLEMQLALSSPYQMRRWVQSVVSSARTLREALKPFMALICLTRKWKYAELWEPCVRAGGTDSVALKYLTGALPPTLERDELLRLKLYRANSRRYVFKPRSGVPGRVFLTMRPEWLPLLNDPVAFPRAPHAVRHKVEVTFAVPVIVNGSVQMVVEFFDTDRRDYDPQTMNMANEIAVLFGKAFTGHLSFGVDGGM